MKIDGIEFYLHVNEDMREELIEDGKLTFESEFELVDETLSNSDPEDGGGTYEVVFKHLETGKFYTNQYTDWDMENTEIDALLNGNEDARCDMNNCDMKEVFLKTKIVKYYE